MSTITDVLRPLNRTTATVRGRAISLAKPSSVTQKFFARGEEQEATGYENLAHDDPILAPPELEFDSFDKIPRRRGSLFAAAVSMLVVAAIGFVTWRSFHSLSAHGSSVAIASRAMVQVPPPPAEPAPAAQSAPIPPAPIAQSMTIEPPAPPVPVTHSTPAARPAPVAEPAPIVIPVITKRVPMAHERAKSDTDDKPVEIRKHPPLRGFVWSPEKHTLVPADPVLEDPPPAEPARARSLDGTPAEQPQPPPDPTSPEPFQLPATPAPAPNAAPIIE